MKIIRNNKEISLETALQHHINKDDVYLQFKDLDKDVWLELREKYVTGTGGVQLLGVSPFHTYKNIYQKVHTEEITEAPKYRKFVLQATQLGKKYESFVIKQMAKELNVEYEESQDLYTWEKYSLSCTPDALVGNNSLIEAKCQGSHKIEKWDEQPYFNYLVQCYMQMMLTRRDICYLSVMFFNNWPVFDREEEEKYLDLHEEVDLPDITPFKIRVYEIKRSEAFEEYFLDKVKKLWYGVKRLNNKQKEIKKILNDNVSLIIDKNIGKNTMSKINTQIMKQNALFLSDGCLKQAKELVSEYRSFFEGKEHLQGHQKKILNMGKAWKQTKNISLTRFVKLMLKNIENIGDKNVENIVLNSMNVAVKKYTIESIEDFIYYHKEILDVYKKYIRIHKNVNSIHMMSMGKVWAETNHADLYEFLKKTIKYIGESNE